LSLGLAEPWGLPNLDRLEIAHLTRFLHAKR
jgi:hypothetical protein